MHHENDKDKGRLEIWLWTNKWHPVPPYGQIMWYLLPVQWKKYMKKYIKL